tara:strand:- start:15599 stop:15802 length:204 start_codon:yes stop_codon:yes gene_type:complete
MPECSFCKRQYEFPRGMTLVLANGDLLRFCSSKCQKNNKLGRIGKKVNWVRKEKKVAKVSGEVAKKE